MENIISTIHSYLFMGIATLLLFQSIILFSHSQQNRARQTMAIIESVWGLTYTLILIYILNYVSTNEFSLFREKVLIVGSFFITLTHFFPIQVLLPGWLNINKAILLFLPNIVLTGIYYGINHLLGECTEDITSYAMLWSSIGHFNIWFRFVILLSNIVYLAGILSWLRKYEKKYIQWKNDNFADQEYVDISWMRSCYYIIVGISVLYMAILFIGGRIPVLCHSVFVTISFSYLFYKILFYKNCYLDDFCESNTAYSKDRALTDNSTLNNQKSTDIMDEKFIDDKIPHYINIIKEWMEKEKPYLYHDFKLTDMDRILPLNRTYLSHVINEGFGQTFSETIRMYRVNYAKSLLESDPTLPIYKVAEVSGFRSSTSFTRAFKQVLKITPYQYREQFTENRNRPL